MNQRISKQGVCRTAPATPGLNKFIIRPTRKVDVVTLDF